MVVECLCANNHANNLFMWKDARVRGFYISRCTSFGSQQVGWSLTYTPNNKCDTSIGLVERTAVFCCSIGPKPNLQTFFLEAYEIFMTSVTWWIEIDSEVWAKLVPKGGFTLLRFCLHTYVNIKNIRPLHWLCVFPSPLALRVFSKIHFHEQTDSERFVKVEQVSTFSLLPVFECRSNINRRDHARNQGISCLVKDLQP